MWSGHGREREAGRGGREAGRQASFGPKRRSKWVGGHKSQNMMYTEGPQIQNGAPIEAPRTERTCLAVLGHVTSSKRVREMRRFCSEGGARNKAGEVLAGEKLDQAPNDHYLPMVSLQKCVGLSVF